MQRKDFEIMAPVGSWESLTAALQGGADAIYFGVDGLNMRSRSSNNFTLDDLTTIATTCAEHNVKSYLTVNTIIYNNDLPLMRQVIDAAKASGISAIIACDIAAMDYAVRQDVEVHLSTQLNISNVEALRFYAQYADVVVLARELSLDQVKDIHHAIEEEHIVGRHGKPIRIEMFCHGALCMAVSGKCYLSLHEYNASANRGACMQVCRHGYTVSDKSSDIELDIDNQYIMSPKDLKTIHFLNKMVDAGVRVLKIEGRARGADYVRNVVECYNEALNSIVDGSYSEEKIAVWDARLSRVFNRGFWNGYYLGQRLGEWSSVYGSQATRKKVYIGRCTNYFSKLGVAEFFLETQDFNVGDEYLITGATTGAVEGIVEELRTDRDPVDKVEKGVYFSMKVGEIVHRNDRLYKMVTTENES
ncbi:MAG: peptidase U32 family protein [Bacteroidales bacterium]|nr:peptidase U32 family protein [Bacteroidales bacterium]